MPLLQVGIKLETPGIAYALLALLLAAVVSFAVTPLVKMLSVKVGAVDVPKDKDRKSVV